jgi:biotin carboxylase
MNLLVTNSHSPQAYAIIRALRPHARRVVATFEGDRLAARLSHGANSRLVDRSYRVPSPIRDWWEGRISAENTPHEDAYIEAIRHICVREEIDVIYPSWDPYVYILSKNRHRLASMGITVPVPDLDTVVTALDKYRTIMAGKHVGFPCPDTVLHDPQVPLDAVAQRLGFPLVIKPRFTSGGHGMAIVRDRAELDTALPRVIAKHGNPLLQQYIPGGKRDSVQFVMARDGAVVFAFHKRRRRTFRRTARFGTVSESAAPDARVLQSSALLSHLGWWGAMGIETIYDPRDGQNKLMEINPRFPRQLWNRVELGINEPLMCLQIARGERVDPVAPYPTGVLFVSPMEDVQLAVLQVVDLGLYKIRRLTRLGSPIDPMSPPPSLRSLARSFGQTYLTRRQRVWDPYFRHFFHDPVPSTLWWMQFSTWLAGSWRELGR